MKKDSINLLKNSNWKYILIVAILAVIVAGRILGYCWGIKKEVKISENEISKVEAPEVKVPEVKVPEVKVPKEEIIPKEIIVNLEKFNTIEDAIVYYLNQYPNKPEILEKLIIKYPREYGDYTIEKLINWMEEVDLDNDGLKELALCYIDPYKGFDFRGFDSNFSVVKKKEGLYKITFTYYLDIYSNYFIRDVNQDDKLEVVITTRSCGACHCSQNITTLQFDGQEWRNLTPSTVFNVSLSDFDTYIKWEDLDGNGIDEIILRKGIIGCAGAGMQRNRIEIYTYKEGEYRLIKTIGDAEYNIYYLMLDANRALKENNLTDALKLATYALQNPNFGVSSDENAYINERDQVRILSYAAIIAMLVYLKQSPPDLNSVDSLLQEITEKYNKFDNPYINAAQILRDTYLASRDIQKACQAMKDEILKVGDNAEFLHNYGYNTEKLNLKDLCPLH